MAPSRDTLRVHGTSLGMGGHTCEALCTSGCMVHIRLLGDTSAGSGGSRSSEHCRTSDRMRRETGGKGRWE